MVSAAAGAGPQAGGGGVGGKTRVLFVCLGNICRSPSAEAVFKSGALLREAAGTLLP